jgi:hypothetical protein
MRRRSFLRIGAGAAAAPLFAPRRLLAASQADSPITIAYHSQATTWSGRADGVGVGTFSVNASAVNTMVDQAIMAYTGQSTVGAAWQSLFTRRGISVSTATKVGIKINNAYDRSVSGYTNTRCPYGPRVETVNAIAAGLTRMLGGTFPIENITAFDKWVYYFEPAPDSDTTKMVLAGFPAYAFSPYDVSGAGRYRAVLVDPRQPSNDAADRFTCGVTSTVQQRMLPIVPAQTAWIDLCLPKVNIGAGVTGCMKNTYGMTDNCNATHDPAGSTPGIHDCVPAFYKAIDGRRPCVLNILDGLAGNYDEQAFGGPSFIANEIAMCTDPVALDVYTTSLVNAARRANRLHDIEIPPTTADRYTLQSGASYPGTLNVDGYPNVHSLAIAAAAPHSLGNLTYVANRLDVTGVAGDSMPPLDRAQGRPGAVVRTSSGFRLEVALDRSGREHTIHGRILSLDGREVRSFATHRISGNTASQDWDCRTHAGSVVSAGAYCWELTVDGRTFTQPVQVAY